MLRHHRRRCSACHPRGAEAGFTLIELLIVIAILVVLMGPMALAFSTSLRTTDRVEQSVTASQVRERLAIA